MSLHINNVKTSLLILLLLSALIFSVVCIDGFYFRNEGQLTSPETTAERLQRESQPGTPITISAEDEARLKDESAPASAGKKMDAATMERLQMESGTSAQ